MKFIEVTTENNTDITVGVRESSVKATHLFIRK